MKVSALALLPLAGLASADVPAWGQCGGESYTGSTTCISGWTCVYSDPWWSQCQPSSSSSSWTTTTTTTTSSASSTASIVAAYGQCGGQGYTGPTDCVAGYTCSVSNQWYSQCVPGSASSSSSTSTTISSSIITTTSSTTTSSSITTGSGTTTTSSSSSTTATGFAGHTGLNFTIGGQPGYFAGTNSYWIGFLTNNNDVDSVFDHMKQSGIKILRVWGFNDVNSQPSSGTVYFQLLSNGQATINTGPDGLQRLDYVVAAAEARGIKLIINFVNYWNDYGGMNAYIHGFASGADVTTWYTNSAIQAAYRAYIKAVVSRYINSDAIFAWELANEPRCRGCATSVITSWAQSTSAYIKSLDSKHMVCVGDEGMGITTGSDGSYPYTTYEGVAFNDLIAIDTIDFGTIHLYPSQWGVGNSWGNDWIVNHGAACAAAGKPCLLEEYGVTSDKCNVEDQWQTTALGATGISADLFWQWGDTISSGQTPNDDYTIYDPSSDFTCLVTNHVAAISSR